MSLLRSYVLFFFFLLLILLLLFIFIYKGLQKVSFMSSNGSNNGEVRICPTAQTLFSVQPITRVLEVQMRQFMFCWKEETISQNFHEDYLFQF